MIRLIYMSIQKATKDVVGVTQVTLDTDGTLVELGTVTVKKGSKNFKAILMDGSNLDGKYKTKKQAGGALQKNHNAADVVVATEPVPAAPVEEPKVEEPKPAPKPEPVVEAAPEPVVEAVEEIHIPSHENSVSPLLLDDGFDGDDDYPEMPIFLRRDLWSDEEWELNSAVS